ncbi:hypothetical protein FRC01_007054 [Tulasnella sp. 417]|nr:hypothetical protein FRC01_007054 [Tulasnella sp. 417]
MTSTVTSTTSPITAAKLQPVRAQNMGGDDPNLQQVREFKKDPTDDLGTLMRSRWSVYFPSAFFQKHSRETQHERSDLRAFLAGSIRTASLPTPSTSPYGMRPIGPPQNFTCTSTAAENLRKLGDKQGRADALWALAEVHRLEKEYSQAMAFFSEALTISTDICDKYGRAFSLQCMARAHHDQGDLNRAIDYNEQAAKIYNKSDILKTKRLYWRERQTSVV